MKAFPGAQVVIKHESKFVPPKLSSFCSPNLVPEIKNGGQNLIDFLGQHFDHFWGQKLGVNLKTIHRPEFHPSGQLHICGQK